MQFDTRSELVDSISDKQEISTPLFADDDEIVRKRI